MSLMFIPPANSIDIVIKTRLISAYSIRPYLGHIMWTRLDAIIVANKYATSEPTRKFAHILSYYIRPTQQQIK